MLAALAAEGARHVYADGGEVVTGFLAARLPRRAGRLIVPVVLGTGIRLFARAAPVGTLSGLESARTYASGWSSSGT